nr:phosphatase PAP2 family protein [uncultured Noviherbaspirillum sp.]
MPGRMPDDAFAPAHYPSDRAGGWLRTSAILSKFRNMNYDAKQPPATVHTLPHARYREQPGVAASRLQTRLAIAVLALSLLAFLLLAYQVVYKGPATALDQRLAHWLHANGSAPLTEALLAVTQMHAPAGIAVLAAGMAIYMALKRDHYWLLAVLLTMPAGMILNVLLKNLFERHRPVFEQPLVMLATYSFPSGHAAYSTMLYGLLAAYVAHRVDRWQWRLVSVLVCGAIVALVAFSRLYLGAHFLTDVLAGAFEGLAWLALIWLVVTRLRRRQAPGAGY